GCARRRPVLRPVRVATAVARTTTARRTTAIAVFASSCALIRTCDELSRCELPTDPTWRGTRLEPTFRSRFRRQRVGPIDRSGGVSSMRSLSGPSPSDMFTTQRPLFVAALMLLPSLACGNSGSATTSGAGGTGVASGQGGSSGLVGGTGIGGSGSTGAAGGGSSGSAGNGATGTGASGASGGTSGTGTDAAVPVVGSADASATCTPGVEELVITNCGYPTTTSNPLTATVFNENEVFRAIRPAGSWPNGVVQMFYNDEHAMTLGVREVAVKTSSATTTTDYPITALTTDPGSSTNPQTGTNMLI